MASITPDGEFPAGDNQKPGATHRFAKILSVAIGSILCLHTAQAHGADGPGSDPADQAVENTFVPNGMEFDGNVHIEMDPPVTTDVFTVEMWVKLPEAG